MDIRNTMFNSIDTINQYRSMVQKDIEKAGSGVELDHIPDREEMAELAGRLNTAVDSTNARLSFSYNDKANRIVVKVINTQTNEVIREVPPKDVIRLLEHMKEYMGIMVDESR